MMPVHRDWSGVIRDSDQIGKPFDDTPPEPENDDGDTIVRGED